MAKNTFTCWHGDEVDRDDETEIEASSPERAAQEFALQSDDGDDSDIVYVLVDGRVHEYKCRYRRSVTCDARRTATYPVPS